MMILDEKFQSFSITMGAFVSVAPLESGQATRWRWDFFFHAMPEHVRPNGVRQPKQSHGTTKNEV